jgi:hypothetical protein
VKINRPDPLDSGSGVAYLVITMTNRNAPLGPLNLTRTAAALVDLDRADHAIDSLDVATDATLVGLLEACDLARDALGEAFALDTADRNRPEDAAAWARHRPEDMRRLVAAFPPA